jgi:ribosome-binding factor A
MTRRTQRIGEQLREEIARVLLEDVTDPRIGMVSLTKVDCAPDLSNAIVYWSTLKAESEESIEAVATGLASAAAFVRGRVARRLRAAREFLTVISAAAESAVDTAYSRMVETISAA